MKLFPIRLVMVMMASAAVVQAGSVPDSPNANVVSQYEYSSVSYGSNQDGHTYSRVVTMHNGVKDSDITTVNGVVSNVLWDKNAQGTYTPGYILGVGLKDGQVTAKAVETKRIQAESGTIHQLEAPAAVLGDVAFRGNGTVSGLQTNGSDPTSAVSVQYLQDCLAVKPIDTNGQYSLLKTLSDIQNKVAQLEQENKQLKAEIESLKK